MKDMGRVNGRGTKRSRETVEFCIMTAFIGVTGERKSRAQFRLQLLIQLHLLFFATQIHRACNNAHEYMKSMHISSASALRANWRVPPGLRNQKCKSGRSKTTQGKDGAL